jgi:hypothetical protein
MCDPFRHLHMPPELACEFLAVFARMEYALKATGKYAAGGEDRVSANWDRFANDIDESFCAVEDERFRRAVDYLLTQPPRKQVLRQGAVTFVDQQIDTKQLKAQQTLLMTRSVRNNLFHGGKHLPDGEREAGRNAQLVSSALAVLKHCVAMQPAVQQCYDL